MAAKKQTSGTFTVNTMDESVTYEVRLSSASVRFTKSGGIEPSSIKASAVAVSSVDGVTDFIGFMVAKDAQGSTIAYSSTSPLSSSFTIDGSILRSALYPITVNLYKSPSSTSTALAEATINKVEDGGKGDKGDKGEDGITVHVSQPVVAIQTDEFGKPTENALYKEISFDIYKGGTLVEDATVLTINGVQTVQTINGVSLTRSGNKMLYSYYTYNAVTPFVCKVEVRSASLDVNRVCDISFSVVSKGADGKDGQDGVTGKMGRNPYFAGKWDDISTFVVTDYQTPYVEIADANNKPAFYVFVGANGTYSKSTAGTPGSSTNWILMVSDFKYLISEAIFSDFAKLGSGIFNLDFLFSQYGTLVAKGVEQQTSDYRLADPSDMGAAQSEVVFTKDTFTFTGDGNWSNANRIGSFTLQAGVNYGVFAGVKMALGPSVYLRIGRTYASYVAEFSATGESSINSVVKVDTTGTYYLYYSTAPDVEANLHNICVSTAKFRPNVYVDWLKGFIYAQTGKFKDIIIEGVMNNLITDIEATSDRLIKYSWTDSSNNPITEYCLDVLRCGNVVRIKSLPADIKGTSSTNSYLQLPYFITNDDDKQRRTHTRLNADGSVASTSRPVTADEMRMLVGRKLCLIMDFEDAGFNKTYLPVFRAIPNALANEQQSSGSLANAIVEIANGNQHVNDVTSNNLIRSDIALGIKRTIWLECKMIMNVDSNQAIYIWTSSYTANDGGHTDADYLDDAWGG